MKKTPGRTTAEKVKYWTAHIWEQPISNFSLSDRFSQAGSKLIAETNKEVDLVKHNPEVFFKYDGLYGIKPIQAFDTDSPQVKEAKGFVNSDLRYSPSKDTFHFSLFNESMALDTVNDSQGMLPDATKRVDNALRWVDVAAHFSTFDTNKDGVITKQELAAKYPASNFPDLDKQFDQMLKSVKNPKQGGLTRSNIEDFIGKAFDDKECQLVLGEYDGYFPDNNNRSFAERAGQAMSKFAGNDSGKVSQGDLTKFINDPNAPAGAKTVAQISLDNFQAIGEAGQDTWFMHWYKYDTISLDDVREFGRLAVGADDNTVISRAHFRQVMVDVLEHNLVP